MLSQVSSSRAPGVYRKMLKEPPRKPLFDWVVALCTSTLKQRPMEQWRSSTLDVLVALLVIDHERQQSVTACGTTTQKRKEFDFLG